VQVEAGSYKNIALSLGVDAPGDVLFATDNVHEAEAAVAAGWQVRLGLGLRRGSVTTMPATPTLQQAALTAPQQGSHVAEACHAEMPMATRCANVDRSHDVAGR